MVRPFNPDRIQSPKSDISFPKFAGPVDLEIGCGVGLHPIRYAKYHPDRHLIAIERTLTRYSRFERRLANHPFIQNITPVRDDAIAWIVHRVPESSVSRVFLMFPNPYPLSRQKNLRWPLMPFMGFLIERLGDGGTIQLATNSESYMRDAREMFEEHWNLREIQYQEFRKGMSGVEPRTHFERKYFDRGEISYDLVVGK